MTNNGRAGAGTGFHDLTAETSRRAHAAKTWPEAWHGVLHDSTQDFGDGASAFGGATLAVRPHHRKLTGIQSSENLLEEGRIATTDLRALSVSLQNAVRLDEQLRGLGMEWSPHAHCRLSSHKLHIATTLRPETRNRHDSSSTTCSHPHRATARSKTILAQETSRAAHQRSQPYPKSSVHSQPRSRDRAV